MAQDLALRILLEAQDAASKVVKSLGGNISKLGSDAGSVSSSMSSSSGLGGVLGMVAGVAVAAGTALVGIGVKSVNMAADYQQSMNKVQALTGASRAQMGEYDKSLKALAVETGVAPKQLTDGLYNVISAGYSGSTAMKVLELATKDAKIGMTDASVTSNALTVALAAFNVPANQFNAVNGEMLRTVTAGKMSMSDYASAISKTSSVAVQYKDSMSDMNSVLATLTSSGIKNANVAGTDYNNLLKVLNGNTQSVISKSEALNPAFDGNAFSTMNVADKVDYLNKMITSHGHNISEVIGKQQNAAAAYTMLSTHMDTYRKNLKNLSDAQANAKATQDAWAITQDGFNQQLSRLKAAVEVVGISIGQKLLPIVTAITKFAADHLLPAFQAVSGFFSSFDLTPISHAWKQLTDAIQGILSPLNGAGGAVKAFSPFLDALKNSFSQLIVSGIKDVAGVITNIANAIQGLSKNGGASDFFSGMSSSFKQFAPELENIGKLISGEFTRDLKDLGQLAQQVGTWFMNSVVPALKDAEPGFENLAHTVLNTVIPAFFQIRGVVMDVVEHAFKVFGPIIEKIVPPLIRFAGILANDVANGLKFIMPYVIQAAKEIGKFADEIMDRVAPIISKWLAQTQTGMQAFQKVWNAVWPVLAPMLKGVWDQIQGIIKIAWAVVTGIIKIGLDLMSGNWKGAWTDMQDMFKGIWDGIKTYLQGAMEQVVAGLRPLLQAMSNIPGPIGDMAKKVLGSFDSMDQGTKKSTTGVSVSVAVMKANVLARTAEMETEAAKRFDKMRQELITQIQNTSDPVQKHSLEMKLGVVTNMEKMHTQSAQHAQAMANDVVKHAQSMSDQMVGHSVIPDMVNAVIRWFQQMGPRALSAVSDMANQVLGRLNALAGSAISAGASIVNNIASGIRNTIGAVTGAIGSVVAEIDAHLPHSPAKKGPLSQLNLYGPALVNTFAKDIASTSPKARAAAEQMASGVAKAIKSYSDQIALAHVSGNKTQEAALRKQYSDLVAQYKIYTDLAKSHGFTMNSKDANNPINFGGNTANSGALSMVARFTADLKANTPKAQAAAEQMMVGIQKVLLTYPAAIAKAHLQGNKIQEAALRKQYTNMKDQFTLYKKLIDQNGFVYNAKSNTPIDFHPVLHLGSASSTASSSNGGSAPSGGLSITNNITINANNADPNKVYQLVLKQITRDLTRSGGLVTTTSGGRS